MPTGSMLEEINALHDISPLERFDRRTRKRVYIETYGCQMNVYDSELVGRIMRDMSYDLVDEPESADAIFLNTCAIRENAEQRVWGQLTRFKRLKERNPSLVIGVLGCMAKHLEEEIHRKRPYVNLVLGPDSYRNIPQMLAEKSSALHRIGFVNQVSETDFDLTEYRDFQLKPIQIDTKLSRTELYDGITPLRSGGITAWISIMRGCDNFCTFCVVPFTRGRERSRPVASVVAEARRAVEDGYREITLLGQNVNSYRDGDEDFAALMEAVSHVAGVRRIRFMSPHPKDFPDRLLRVIKENPNICKHIHMPVQSGSNRLLDLMNRTYTREEYLALIEKTRRHMPDVAISTDVISGFPTETVEDHRQTLDLLRTVGFDSAFTFKYSARPMTKAYAMKDDVPEEEKKRRLQEIIDLQRQSGLRKIRAEVGHVREVLIEEVSRKSDEFYCARTDKAQIVIVPRADKKIGEFVQVRISRADGHSLFGEYV